MNIPDIPKGIRGKRETVVKYENTAQYLLSGMLEVYATPSLISFMEFTSFMSLEEFLPEGMGTVGTKVDIRHTAASPVGAHITCESELLEVDGRRLVFSVKAWDEHGVIGEGIHERFIIDNARFVDKLNNRGNKD